MRQKKSIKNAIISIVMNIVTILFGFVTQKIFIMQLGREYLGLNGLFSNILSMLSIAELGFGTAVIYQLYKPIANNDTKKIKTLLTFYKKAYNIIALIIFVIGCLITPFIPLLVGKITVQCNLYLLFFLSLVDIVCSYLMTYKRSILYADQKNYVINIVHIFYTIVMNSLQIFFLFKFSNYIMYLLIKILCRIAENLIINIYVNKKYLFLKEKENISSIDDKTKKDIFSQINGLLFHKIGRAVVLGTDNILISKFLGVAVVGLYSNYYLIINSLNNLFGHIFSSVAGSVGNLLVTESKEKSYQVYKNILFVNSWIYCLSGMLILSLIQPFIKIWVGPDFCLSNSVVLILIINFYIQGIEKTSILFKESAGVFFEDRYIPIIQAISNIVFSILMVNFFGLFGIFLGTTISSIILFVYSYPKFVYKKIFDKSYYEYFKDLSIHILIFIFNIIICVFLVNKIELESQFLNLIIRAFITFIYSNVIYLLIFKNRIEFIYFKKIVLKNKK